jgi:hypothetical protein
MVRTREMITTHPRPALRDGLVECINACYDCAQVCNICADACLSETSAANLVRCIRLNLDCASICQATGEVLARQTDMEPSIVRALLQACIEACRICAIECERHGANMEHCRVCAAECRRCEQASRNMLDQI